MIVIVFVGIDIIDIYNNKELMINTSLNKSQAKHIDGATNIKSPSNGMCQNLSPIR